MITFILEFLIGPSRSVSGATNFGSITYSRVQLLVLHHTVTSSVPKMEIPVEPGRKRRGCRAGVKHRQKKRRHKPFLPAIIMGNVWSLWNKMEEFTALTRMQREFQEFSFMGRPDSIATLDSFYLV